MFRYIIGGAFIFTISFAIIYFITRRLKSGEGKSRKRWPALLALGVTMIYLFLLPSAFNNPSAILQSSGGKHRLTFTGSRLEQDTGWWSKLFPSVTTDTFWVEVKRTKGRLTGKDITSHKGDFHMFGKIEMKETTVTVELFFDNAANRTTDPLEWNGEYILERITQKVN